MSRSYARLFSYDVSIRARLLQMRLSQSSRQDDEVMSKLTLAGMVRSFLIFVPSSAIMVLIRFLTSVFDSEIFARMSLFGPSPSS